MRDDRIIVTGIGVVSPLGIGVQPFWTSLLAGETGVRPITLFDTDGLACRDAAEVSGFDARAHLSKKGLRNLNRAITFARTAAKLALAEAGFAEQPPDPAATGVVLGTNGSCTNQMLEFDHNASRGFVDPLMFPNTGVSAPACQISVFEGYHSQTSTLSSGHAAGLEAIGAGAAVLRADEATLVIVGGVEELCAATYGAASSAGRLFEANGHRHWPGPFGGAGIVMGEGAACLILEREAHARVRGATPLAEVAGAAAAFDPDVFWGQPPRVDLMRDVVDRALRESGVTAEQIDLVVSGAHGDPVCDAAEAALLVNLFDGRRVPIMAVCAQIGAADGATGAFQAAAAVLALRDRRIGGRAASTEFPLDLVDRSRPFDGATCLVTAFGSLGERMALVIRRPD